MGCEAGRPICAFVAGGAAIATAMTSVVEQAPTPGGAVLVPGAEILTGGGWAGLPAAGCPNDRCAPRRLWSQKGGGGGGLFLAAQKGGGGGGLFLAAGRTTSRGPAPNVLWRAGSLPVV